MVQNNVIHGMDEKKISLYVSKGDWKLEASSESDVETYC